jgi:DNA processing protein
LSDAQRLDWLRLIRTESVGPQTFRALINRFGGAGAALKALPSLAAQKGRAITPADEGNCLREMEALQRRGAQLIALGEAEYPATLRAIHGPPPLIAVQGDLSVLQRPMIAVIGSRNASASGLAFTERVVRDLAAAGLVIVSGLARGVDGRAHQASLGTGTIGVVAGGLDKLYPTEHLQLAADMTAHGLLLSEMPMGWEPRGRDFPRRNRLVAGLSIATLVIEASRGSGSLITAKFAADQGREIFAVPGSPLDARAEGTNDLLRQGANLCTRAQDILDVLLPMIEKDTFRRDDLFNEAPQLTPTEPLWDELDLIYEGETPHTVAGLSFDEPIRQLGPSAAPTVRSPGSDARARIEALLGPSPVSIDDLSRVSDVSIADLRSIIFELDLENRIERHGALMISLKPRS